MPEAERRLAAIMFTDIVGYSAISSVDEGRALKLLEEHRVILQTAFANYGGIIIKTMGDGFLVEFTSAVEAVKGAVEAQVQLNGLNKERAAGQTAVIRIGIHVGDVVHSSGDVLGDAVNVAARLQQVAEPGGICISRQVVDQIERKVDYRLVKIGTRELKNIRYTVEIYKVELPVGSPLTEETDLNPRRIAILPLANLSSDPNDRYFADGMTEELISTISRIPELSVISRTSVMRYKDTTVPIGDIGKELSAGTVLEGSVRKAGNKVRITTQLIDAQNDRHLWAQSYDRDLTDIFAIQGDIAEKVADALRIRLVSSQREAVEKEATRSPEAYTLYLRGRFYWNERSYEGIKKAVTCFEEAIKLDPKFANAYSGLADCYNIQIDRTWISFKEGGGKARAYAEKAVELDGDSAEAHSSLGLVLETAWDFAGAEEAFRHAIALRPGYSTVHHWYALLLGHVGRFNEALEEEKTAYELDPRSSVITQGLGILLYNLGRTREGLEYMEKVEKSDPTFDPIHYWKAWLYLEIGETEKAVLEAKKRTESSESRYLLNMGLVSILVRAGRREEALNLFAEAEANAESERSYKSLTQLAMTKFDLGEIDEAFEILRKAMDEHDNFIIYLQEFPAYKKMLEDPRWKEIEKLLTGVVKR